MRRYIIIAVTALILLAGLVGVYFWLGQGGSIAVGTLGDVTLPGADSIPVIGDAGSEPTATTTSVVRPGSTPPRLVKISSGPVALGALVAPLSGLTSTTTELTVSFVERRSGNVYRYSVPTGTLTRTSNRTLPGVISAAWLSDASLAVVQYLSGADAPVINTYALPSDGTPGFFLPQGLSSVSVSSSTILSLATGVNGSVASVTRSDGSNTANVFTTPLTQLRVSFAGKGRYLAVTKPTQTLLGDAFLVAGGVFTRVAGPSSGLVASASPTGRWILISTAANGVISTRLFDTSSRTTISLPLATIADKCTWTADESALYCGVPTSPSGSYAYPDDWYQGAVSFYDRIWKIDVQGRYAQLVVDVAKQTNAPLDAVALSVDAKNSYLTFINKIDGSLWGFSL